MIDLGLFIIYILLFASLLGIVSFLIKQVWADRAEIITIVSRVLPFIILLLLSMIIAGLDDFSLVNISLNFVYVLAVSSLLSLVGLELYKVIK